MRLLTVSIICAFTLVAWAPPQGVFNLTEEELAALPDTARADYQSARSAFGERQYIPGLRLLMRAAEEGDESAPLQFVLAQIATNLAGNRSADEAPQFLRVAGLAHQRVLDSASATDEERSQAQAGLDALGPMGESIRVEAETEAHEAEHRDAVMGQVNEIAERQMEEHQAREAQEHRSAPRQTTQPPPSAPGDPPRYTGSNRYMQGIQDSRDLRNSSQQPQ